jgi:hypothetical protein
VAGYNKVTLYPSANPTTHLAQPHLNSTFCRHKHEARPSGLHVQLALDAFENAARNKKPAGLLTLNPSPIANISVLRRAGAFSGNDVTALDENTTDFVTCSYASLPKPI